MTDEDIRLAIQNASGPKSALFVPEVGVDKCCFVWKLHTFYFLLMYYNY